MAVKHPLRAEAIDADPDEFAVLRARKANGELYALADVLCRVVLGLMPACRSLSAIGRFGARHPEIVPVLGLCAVPSVSTLSRVLAGVNPGAVRAALRQFALDLATQRRVSIAVAAMDGKTLRGVHENQGHTHMLHLFALEDAIVLGQVPVSSVRREAAAAEEWITEIASSFPGLQVLTADALYADRGLCAAIVAQDFA